MLDTSLHAVCRDRPGLLANIDLRSPRPEHFAGPGSRQDRKLERTGCHAFLKCIADRGDSKHTSANGKKSQKGNEYRGLFNVSEYQRMPTNCWVAEGEKLKSKILSQDFEALRCGSSILVNRCVTSKLWEMFDTVKVLEDG